MSCLTEQSSYDPKHMNTVTHIVVASAALSRQNSPLRNRAVLAGALLPDLSIYVMSFWAIATGNMNAHLWQVTYWQEPWQMMGAITNSVPLAFLLLAAGIWKRWTPLIALAGALLIHAALDFPLHADDAHRHFWPLTDWRFHSPISYWDQDYHGLWGALFDCAVLFCSLVILWIRFQTRWVRAVIAVLALLGLLYAGLIIR